MKKIIPYLPWVLLLLLISLGSKVPAEIVETTITEVDVQIVKDTVYVYPDLTKPSIDVVATVYHAVAEQCDDTPDLTACWLKINTENAFEHKYLAVSRDLLKFFPYGTKVLVEGTPYDGIYLVADTMNKRFNRRIDILIDKSMVGGKFNNVKITKVL